MPRRAARSGADDGTHAGEQVGTPIGAEPAGDLAVDSRGPQLALGAVVACGHLGMVEEGEQVRAELAVAPSQAPAVAVVGSKRHDGIKRALEAAAILASGARGQAAAPAREHGGAQQHGIGAVAQLVRQADLPVLGVALLRPVKVGHPERRAVPAQHFADNACAAAAADDVDHHLAILEHPVPAGAAIDAHAGLVRANNTGAAQPGQDAGRLGIDV